MLIMPFGYAFLVFAVFDFVTSSHSLPHPGKSADAHPSRNGLFIASSRPGTTGISHPQVPRQEDPDLAFSPETVTVTETISTLVYETVTETLNFVDPTLGSQVVVETVTEMPERRARREESAGPPSFGQGDTIAINTSASLPITKRQDGCCEGGGDPEGGENPEIVTVTASTTFTTTITRTEFVTETEAPAATTTIFGTTTVFEPPDETPTDDGQDEPQPSPPEDGETPTDLDGEEEEDEPEPSDSDIPGDEDGNSTDDEDEDDTDSTPGPFPTNSAGVTSAPGSPSGTQTSSGATEERPSSTGDTTQTASESTSANEPTTSGTKTDTADATSEGTSTPTAPSSEESQDTSLNPDETAAIIAGAVILLVLLVVLAIMFCCHYKNRHLTSPSPDREMVPIAPIRGPISRPVPPTAALPPLHETDGESEVMGRPATTAPGRPGWPTQSQVRIPIQPYPKRRTLSSELSPFGYTFPPGYRPEGGGDGDEAGPSGNNRHSNGDNGGSGSVRWPSVSSAWMHFFDMQAIWNATGARDGNGNGNGNGSGSRPISQNSGSRGGINNGGATPNSSRSQSQYSTEEIGRAIPLQAPPNVL